ncbi:hydrocephalus-inducing protein homolog, partial [Corapipo altera]|uniref:hydrocephalus-inducing protein homolog n=1 Tax=Corapipo altera TaxID=415028 RepID=UPI000FD6AB9B
MSCHSDNKELNSKRSFILPGHSHQKSRDAWCLLSHLCHFLGFPQTLSCHLINTSVVPITFHLRIPEDGQGQPSLSSFDQVKYNTHPSWEKGTLAPCQEKPREFTITPSTGTIPAQGFQEIKVTLCSNDVGQYDCDMVVDVDGFGKEVLALRLKA